MLFEVSCVIVNQPTPAFTRAIRGYRAGQDTICHLTALREWQHYVWLIESHLGLRTCNVRVNSEHPDCRYMEDCCRVIYLPGRRPRKILLEMPYGHDTRKPERRDAVAAVKAHAEFDFVIETPDELRADGGDTYYLPEIRTLFVGVSNRTQREFCAYAAEELARFDVQVQPVPVNDGTLHLITASSPLGPRMVAMHRPSIADHTVFDRHGVEIVEVPEQDGANVVCYRDKLLIAAHCPASAEIYRGLGFDVETFDNENSAKANGSPTCDTVMIPA